MGEYYIGKLPISSDELYHYGIPNMKHGVRRFQDKDGHLTPAGRIRYGVGSPIERIVSTTANAANTIKKSSQNYPYGTRTSSYTKPNGVQVTNIDEKRRGSDPFDNRYSVGSMTGFVVPGVNKPVGLVTNRNVYERGKINQSIDDAKKAIAPTVDKAKSAVEKAFNRDAILREGNVNYLREHSKANDAQNAANNRMNEVEGLANDYNNPRNLSSHPENPDNRELSYYRQQIAPDLQRAQNEARIRSVDANRQYALAEKTARDYENQYNQHWQTRAENAAANAQNAINNAVANARNWGGNAVNNVQNAVNNAVSNAGNWVNNAANDAQNWAGNAYNNAQNWAGNAANNVQNAVNNAVDNAGNWVNNAANDAQNLAGNAASDVQDWATNAYEDASKWVGNAANDAKNFAANTAKDIGDWGSEQLNKGKALFRRIFG